MIRERIRRVRVIEEDESPGTFLETGSAHEPRGRAPYRHDVIGHEALQRGDKGVEVDAQRSVRLSEDRDRRNLALVERRECGSPWHGGLLFAVCSLVCTARC